MKVWFWTVDLNAGLSYFDWDGDLDHHIIWVNIRKMINNPDEHISDYTLAIL